MSKRLLLEALSRATSISELQSTPKRANFDPFLDQYEVLKSFIEEKGLWDEACVSINSSFECSPSTSVHQPNADIDDSRIPFARLLLYLLSQLADCLALEKAKTDDEYTLLSLRDLGVLRRTLQFLVLSGIAPYLEPGVGVPIRKRSTFIKAWKSITEDTELQTAQLHQVCHVLLKLCSSNELMKTEISSKFLTDFICANEQLLHLGDSSLKSDYEGIMSTVATGELVRDITILTKKTAETQAPPPPWFQIALGKRLSQLLSADGGLFALLSAYRDMMSPTVWQDSHFAAVIAKQLSTVPQSSKRIAYYETVTRQFIDLIVNNRLPNCEIPRLFGYYCDEMGKKCALALSIFVLDVLFKCWETLNLRCRASSNKEVPWSPSIDISLTILNLWENTRKRPSFMSTSDRPVQNASMFLSLLSSDLFLHEENVPIVVEVRKKFISALKVSLHNLENKAEYLMEFMANSSLDLLQLDRDANKGLDSFKFRLNSLSEESVIEARTRSILMYAKDLPNSHRLLLECLSIAVQRWQRAKKEDPLDSRFVSVSPETEWRVTSAHLIVGLLFEELSECDIPFGDSASFLILTNIALMILREVCDWLKEIEEERSNVDVSASEYESDELAQIMCKNARLAVGLAGSLLIAAPSEGEELGTALAEFLTQLSLFVKLMKGSIVVPQELRSVSDDAESMVKLLEGDVSGISSNEKQGMVPSAQRKKTEMEELRDDLNDEFEAVRGQALVAVSRMIRKRYAQVKGEISEWMYAKMMELLHDRDSYVYLNAINALSELAVVDTVYLNKLIETQKEWREQQKKEKEGRKGELREGGGGGDTVGSEEKEEDEKIGIEKVGEQVDQTTLIMRGRLAEATGKVFRMLGDLAPSFLASTIYMYLWDLNEDEEICRAGALSAISDIVSACRGRGIEQHMNELMHSIQHILSVDKSSLVRRSAVHLLREIIRSSGRTMIEVLGEHTRDIRRLVMRLRDWDEDHIVRLHADLCVQEMAACLDEMIRGEGEGIVRNVVPAGLM